MGCLNNGLGSYQKWFIGNDIRTILLDNEEIVKQVGENIYPLIAPENTNGDFIVYYRQKYKKNMVKMGVYEDECEVTVVGISDNYDNAISLASKIDNTLSGSHNFNKNRFQITLSDSTELFEDDKYIEKLTFTIK